MIAYAKPKMKSPAAVAAAGRAEIEPGSNKSLSPNGDSETHAIPPVNPAHQCMVDDAFDQFIAHSAMAEICYLLRQASNHPAAHKYERALLESPLRGDGRMRLAGLAYARTREIFVAVIAGRGFNGRRRTVLLQDLRLFGSKFIEEDHLWTRYNALWERIEPFLQGEKVVLVGTATEYTRKNHTCDYTLVPDYVTKLWPPNKTTVPSCNQSSMRSE